MTTTAITAAAATTTTTATTTTVTTTIASAHRSLVFSKFSLMSTLPQRLTRKLPQCANWTTALYISAIILLMRPGDLETPSPTACSTLLHILNCTVSL